MPIPISPAEEATTWSIDLLTQVTSGERFVVKYVADWDGDTCIGGHVQYAAGPLSDAAVAAIYADPLDWDANPAVEIVNDAYTWQELYAGHR